MRLESSICLLILAIFVMPGTGGCSKQSAAGAAERAGEPGSAKKARPVTVATVVEEPMERAVSVVGSLSAHEESTLSVKVPGPLQTVAVDLGSAVRQGQLIAQVAPRDYELRLKQAEAMLSQARARLGLPLTGDEDRVDLDQTSTVKEAKARWEEARRNRDRIVELQKQGILSESERETADAANDVAASRYRDAVEEVNNRIAQLSQRRAEVEIARQQLADTAIRAPFDGAIQQRRASAGEYMIAGTPVVTIVRTDPLRLRIEAPERESANIRTGQNVRVWVEGDSAPHMGLVNRVSPAIDRQTRMLLVEADIPNNGVLRAGLFVRAEIITSDDRKSLSVPADAIVSFAGIEKVFVVENGKAVERPVSTGRRGTNWVEVVKGVRAGESVVVKPGNLQANEAVDANPPAKTAVKRDARS